MAKELPERPNLERVRKMAKSLHRAAVAGDPEAVARVTAVSDSLSLSAAQTALAREYGFATWADYRAEIERRAASS